MGFGSKRLLLHQVDSDGDEDAWVALEKWNRHLLPGCGRATVRRFEHAREQSVGIYGSQSRTARRHPIVGFSLGDSSVVEQSLGRSRTWAETHAWCRGRLAVTARSRAGPSGHGWAARQAVGSSNAVIAPGECAVYCEGWGCRARQAAEKLEGLAQHASASDAELRDGRPQHSEPHISRYQLDTVYCVHSTVIYNPDTVSPGPIAQHVIAPTAACSCACICACSCSCSCTLGLGHSSAHRHQAHRQLTKPTLDGPCTLG